MEKECRRDVAAAAPPFIIVAALLICALAIMVIVCADARVFPPRRYHISPRTNIKDGDTSFPFPKRYSYDNQACKL